MARIGLVTENDLPSEYRDRTLLGTLSNPEDLPADYRHLLQQQDRNVYRALGRRPPLLAAFREFGRAVWAECGLDARAREIAILTAGRALDAAYEWHQHVRVGLQSGVTQEEIKAIGAENDEVFSAEEQALIAFTRAFVTGTVDAAVLDGFVERFDEETAVGVAILASLYLVVARFADAFKLETEEPFVGWALEGL